MSYNLFYVCYTWIYVNSGTDAYNFDTNIRPIKFLLRLVEWLLKSQMAESESVKSRL